MFSSHLLSRPNCRLNATNRLALQDGSASESMAQLKANPNAKLFSCEFHIKSELRKKGAAGLQDKKLYDSLVHLPAGQTAAAEALYEQLSENSFLRKRPKQQLSPAFLPTGACTHGNTTSNMAEVSHRIFDGGFPTARTAFLLPASADPSCFG